MGKRITLAHTPCYVSTLLKIFLHLNLLTHLHAYPHTNSSLALIYRHVSFPLAVSTHATTGCVCVCVCYYTGHRVPDERYTRGRDSEFLFSGQGMSGMGYLHYVLILPPPSLYSLSSPCPQGSISLSACSDSPHSTVSDQKYHFLSP